MKHLLLMSLSLALFFAPVPMKAQSTAENTGADSDMQKARILVSMPRTLYMANGYDLFMLSSAWYSNSSTATEAITAPRFSGGVNLGVNFHYDVNNSIGFFTGIGIKNIGLHNKTTDSTFARTTKYTEREYAIGVPLGIKLGNLSDRNFLIAGGGIDLPFHYRYKAFYKGERYHKYHKEGEWFSKRTAAVLPYVFVGMSFAPGVVIKAQYYLSNFYNTSFSTKDASGNVIYPYQGVHASLFFLSLSLDIHYNQYKIQERDYQKKKALRNQ